VRTTGCVSSAAIATSALGWFAICASVDCLALSPHSCNAPTPRSSSTSKTRGKACGAAGCARTATSFRGLCATCASAELRDSRRLQTPHSIKTKTLRMPLRRPRPSPPTPATRRIFPTPPARLPQTPIRQKAAARVRQRSAIRSARIRPPRIRAARFECSQNEDLA
jgi:hypothetical protein